MKKDKAKFNPHEVVFYAYPKLIFVWPIILLGILFFFIGQPMVNSKTIEVEVKPDPVASSEGQTNVPAAAEPMTTKVTQYYHSPGLEALGWIYLLICVLVILTIGVDIERNVAMFWMVVILLFFFLGRWLVDAKGFTFFGDVYGFFDGLDVQYNRGLGLVVSILLAIPYGVVMLWARLQNKWRITHNEFEHYSWGRADDSLARGAKRVRSTYPDLLELLLAGAGTLVVYSATGRSELRRIHNVPLLPMKRKKINKILERVAVSDTEDTLAAEETDAENEESDLGGGESTGPEEMGNEQL